ncbi:MAG TPA: DUF6167 family protein [Mycobacteriales bacterium]|nr:DUF6167 family protein [Mycobacteriales bacterium]
MRRLFWVALGATTGVLIARRLTSTARAWTPEGLAGRAGGLGDRARTLWAEVRVGMAEREDELRDALGLDGASDAPGAGEDD